MDYSCSMDFSYTAHFSSIEESYSASADYDNSTEYLPELPSSFMVADTIDPALLTQHHGFANLPNDAPPIQHY